MKIQGATLRVPTAGLRAISSLLVVNDVHRHRHLLLGNLNAIPEIDRTVQFPP